MKNNSGLQVKSVISLFARLLFFIPVWLLVFFPPAGTFDFWQAWVVLAILFIPAALVSVYWLKNDPEVVERRARISEKEPEQKLIMKILYLFFVLTFLVPGFDRRFQWSNVPTPVVIVAEILVLLGYGICLWAIAENRFASRTVQVGEEQTVISTGLYAIVRHPMYLGILLMCIALPLALGSYWAIIPALFIIPVLGARIWNEENVLVRELKGYREYMQKTKYRLIPGIW